MLGAWSTPVALESDCTCQKALERLRANPGREAWLSPKAGLAGRFDPDALWLWLAPRGMDSFQAFFRGRLTKSRVGGCRLEGDVRRGRWSVAFGAFLLLVAVAFVSAAAEEFIAALRLGGPVSSEVLVLAVAAGLLLALLPLNSYGFRRHVRSRDELVTFLELALGDVPRPAAVRSPAPETRA
jgi:hypothetical protein